MPPPDASHYATLEALIRSEERTELACCDLLKHATDYLVREPFVRFHTDAREHQGSTGRCDYFVACRTVGETPGRPDRIIVWLWEVKAPQCPIFVVDNSNRLRPSDDLVDAENQLLYYYEERRRNGQFQEQLGVRRESDVRLGGVIVGSESNKVSIGRRELGIAEIEALYEEAFEIRSRYVYAHNQIRLLHWSQVLRHFQEPA